MIATALPPSGLKLAAAAAEAWPPVPAAAADTAAASTLSLTPLFSIYYTGGGGETKTEQNVIQAATPRVGTLTNLTWRYGSPAGYGARDLVRSEARGYAGRYGIVEEAQTPSSRDTQKCLSFRNSSKKSGLQYSCFCPGATLSLSRVGASPDKAAYVLWYSRADPVGCHHDRQGGGVRGGRHVAHLGRSVQIARTVVHYGARRDTVAASHKRV